ncbi:NB-ARC domain-containing protein [Kutzneria buriramensis]|uniref:Tetratricopeptide repeat protein n=1 Tax=Kutzneria buriramensis TaxID=1045776 RepID=A0A3E0GV52_9PSEU|nr:helix-turn-helix domain-containing protein [Kutzneria buriramensis]REH28441.1 tetratricopeptide repeat protein [Kutzneria buriramensis]
MTELDTAGADTLADLAELLRTLRRRHARTSRDSELTYRELAAKTGWSLTAVAEYFTGKTLPPTDRFDALVVLLGATPAELGALATARDRVAELRRTDRAPAPNSVPRQLPASVRRFTGRATELAALAELLDEPVTPGAVRVAAISGAAGIGKTTLAVQWAHQMAHRFPDGQLYVNLRGFDAGATVSPPAAIRSFLDALHVNQAPESPDAQAALYRSLLADRRMLILLDNARDTAQVRPLLPGAPGCLVLVTSRNQLKGLVATDGAEPITLDVLSADEARELLARAVGAERAAAAPGAVDELVAHCARLPLALAIVAARAAVNPRVPLPDLVRELDESRLSAFAGDDPATDLRAVFSWSYHALEAEAARAFGLLGLAPGPDIDLSAAASLVGRPLQQTRVLLHGLESASLIQQWAPGRYRMHDLIRLYAKDQAADPAALQRLTDFYVHTAFGAERLLQPLLPPIPLDPPADGCTPKVITDQAGALAWFAAEHRNLQAAQCLAADRDVWRLAWTLTTFLYRQGRFHDALAVWRAGEAAAAKLDDPMIRTGTHQLLGAIYGELGRHEEALRHLNIAAGAGDTPGQAYTHHALGWLWSLRGDHQRALRHAAESLRRYRALGMPAGEARELTVMGWYRALSGDFERARCDGEAALATARRHALAEDEALSTSVLGFIAFNTGFHVAARSHLERADTLLYNVGNLYYQATVLDYLGRTHEALDDPAEASCCWRKALALYREQHRAAEADDLERRMADTRVTAPRG